MTADLCDTNVWLSLALSGHAHHEACRDWLDEVDAPASVAFCRWTQQSFLRLLSTAAVLAPYGNPPLSNAESWEAYRTLVSDERIVLHAEEPPEVEARWRAYAARTTPSPKLWMDAFLAAFAVSGGYRLVTTDHAFRQFDGLQPLILGG